MLYALLIYGDPSAAPDYESPEGEKEFQHWMSYTQDLAQQGLMSAGQALQPHQTATTVRVRDGERLITDGPFAETKEVLGGFYVIDVPDLDAALEWAARCPGAKRGNKVEVRPIMEFEEP